MAITRNGAGEAGGVVAWGRALMDSYRVMTVRSPRTGNPITAMFFLIEGKPGQTSVWKTGTSSRVGGGSYELAEGYQAAAYRSLREQEEKDGLVCVIDGEGWRVEGDGRLSRLAVGTNRDSKSSGDVQPAMLGNRASGDE